MGRGGIGDDGKVLSHAENALVLSHKICMATGFLCFFPIPKIPLLRVVFGYSHFLTKIDPK